MERSSGQIVAIMGPGIRAEESHVPLDCLSRRDHHAGALRHGAGAFAGGAEHPRARGDRPDQRRRLRARLVRRSTMRSPGSIAKCARPGRTRTCGTCAATSARICSSRMCAPRPARRPRGRTAIPFAYGRWLFMHNGQIGDWSLIRRRVEALIPDDALQGAHRHDRFRSRVPGDPRRGRRDRSGRRDHAHAHDADRHGARERHQGAAALHRRVRGRRDALCVPLFQQRHAEHAVLPRGAGQRRDRLRAARHRARVLEAGAAGASHHRARRTGRWRCCRSPRSRGWRRSSSRFRAPGSDCRAI